MYWPYFICTMVFVPYVRKRSASHKYDIVDDPTKKVHNAVDSDFFHICSFMYNVKRYILVLFHIFIKKVIFV
jgi:hypothetical protein